MTTTETSPPPAVENISAEEALSRFSSIDGRQTAVLYPAIEPASDIINQLNAKDFFIGAIQSTYSANTGSTPSRTQMRQGPSNRLTELSEDVSIGAVRYGLSIKNPEERYSAIYGKLQAQMHKLRNGKMFADMEATACLQVVESFEQLRGLGRATAELAEEHSKHASGAYEDLKLMTGIIETDDTITEATAQAKAFVGLLTLAGSEVPQQILSRLEAGEFDSHIARDTLRFVMSLDAERAASLPNGLGAISRMARFASGITKRELTDNELISLILANWDSWSKESQSAVMTIRAGFSSSLQTNLRRAKMEYGEIASDSEADTVLPEFETAIIKLSSYIAELNHSRSPTTGINKRLHAAGVEGAFMTRRRRNRLPLTPPVSGGEGLHAVESERPPLRLLRIFPDGSLIEFVEGSAGLKEEYMGREPNPVLSADIDLIFARLASLDFSQGGVRGLKKHPKPLNFDQTSLPLWAFRPAQAEGLSTRSARSKKLRVVLTQPESGALGILKIVNVSDDLNKVLKGWGHTAPRGAR